nr:DUF3040 domain-containing protein [Kineosphaera limosa]
MSEHEQKLLEQMERALYAEDPRFASQMKGSAHSPNRRRVIVGAVGAVVGLAVVVAGVATSLIPLGVVGFVLMVAGVAWAATPARKSKSGGANLKVVPGAGSGGTRRAAKPGKPGSKSKPSGGGSFTQRMEERWDKRRQDGQNF